MQCLKWADDLCTVCSLFVSFFFIYGYLFLYPLYSITVCFQDHSLSFRLIFSFFFWESHRVSINMKFNAKLKPEATSNGIEFLKLDSHSTFWNIEGNNSGGPTHATNQPNHSFLHQLLLLLLRLYIFTEYR